MAPSKMTRRQRAFGLSCAPLLVLLGACGSNSPQEKVDAGQRKYCDAKCFDGGSDGAVDKGVGEAGQAGSFDSGLGRADTLFDDSGARSDSGPSVLVDGAVALDVVGTEAGQEVTPADRLDGGSDVTGTSNGDGPSDVRLAPPDAGPEVAGVAEVLPDVPPDIPSGRDAVDAPATGDGPTADLNLTLLDTGSDVTDVGSDAVEVQPDVSPDISDAPADTPPQSDLLGPPDTSPGACGMGGASWAEPLGGTKAPELEGLATATGGIPWIAGEFWRDYDFGSGVVAHGTGTRSNGFVVKLDPATGLASAAFGFDNPQDQAQTIKAVTVASGGNLGIIGTVQSEIDFTGNYSDGSGPTGNAGVAGVDYLAASQLTNFYAVLDGTSTGSYVNPIKAHMVDVGSGALLVAAANPNQNAIAFCGKTSKIVSVWNASASTKGVRTTTGTGGNTAFGGGNLDLIVFVVDATSGSVKWGKQYGGAGDQVCESIAMDDSGNVIIAGNYSGDLFGLPNVADTSGTTAVLFAAKLDAADGSLVGSAQAWAGTGRSDAFGLTADSAGNIIMGGSIASSVDFGGGHVAAYAGLNDAFVVKFDSSFNSTWVKSYGDAGQDQVINSVGVSSTGDVFIGGTFKGSLTGLGLTNSDNATTDAFAAQLSGADGSTVCTRQYGDAAGSQTIYAVSVARSASGALADSVFVAGSFANTITMGSSVLYSPGSVCTVDNDCGGSGITCHSGHCEASGAISYFVSRLSQ